jgi:hypothetical protein
MLSKYSQLELIWTFKSECYDHVVVIYLECHKVIKIIFVLIVEFLNYAKRIRRTDVLNWE